jgi:hypothetical protein
MSKADQFREYAEEATRWSRQAKTEDAKNTLIDLALTWRQAASLTERRWSVRQSKGSDRAALYEPYAKFDIIRSSFAGPPPALWGANEVVSVV